MIYYLVIGIWKDQQIESLSSLRISTCSPHSTLCWEWSCLSYWCPLSVRTKFLFGQCIKKQYHVHKVEKWVRNRESPCAWTEVGKNTNIKSAMEHIVENWNIVVDSVDFDVVLVFLVTVDHQNECGDGYVRSIRCAMLCSRYCWYIITRNVWKNRIVYGIAHRVRCDHDGWF